MGFLKLLMILGFLGFSHGKVLGALDKDLAKLGDLGRANVLISFRGANRDAIKSIAKVTFASRPGKIQALTQALQSTMHKSQGAVLSFLERQKVPSESFWSSNQMVIRDADLNLLQSLAAFSQVSRIQKLPVIKLSPRKAPISPKANSTAEWGVAMIKADQVWTTFATTGQGVVVANIDTGVRGTHEALVNNFRADHGWYDPYNKTMTPNDIQGHGTHTMGTICGQGGIGVAPGAQWIACKGCGSSSCDSAQLLACGQWVLSPTNPDGTDPQPSLIPDVVSNSWGSNIGGDTWYNATIEAWKAAGIMHAFAIGNSGPGCASGGSPGDQPSTFSVGSTDKNDKLSIFSSKGPAGATSGTTYNKPDIVAPGSNVRSAWKDSDTSYNTISGTSMATPHVAGTLALMLSAYRAQSEGNSTKLDFNAAVATIEKTADTQNLTVPFPNYRCDGFFFSKTKYPNNQFGYGRVNALSAVNATILGGGNATVALKDISFLD